MAILRGGKRIGNFDIRFGIPRDRSLDNVHGDPRLKRKPGGNPQTTINSFIATVNQGEGFARGNRFFVRFYLPSGYKVLANDFSESNVPVNLELESSEMIRNVGVMCNGVELPSRNIVSDEHQIHGPSRQMPTGYSFVNSIRLELLQDKFLRQRMFFENWQNKVFDANTHHMNFYNDYVGTMDIYMLGQYAAEGDRDRVVYGVRLYEVYPDLIEGIPLAMLEMDVPYLQLPITMRYRNWKNLTIDQISGATVGKSHGDVPTIKASKDFGLFGGILNRLPPEIRRAGRDVLGTIKRNLPIGKVTGGRVFPPFL